MANSILIVDDSMLNRILLKEYLVFRGYDVEIASGGQECLDCLAVRNYDCMILDIQMPDIDGLAILKIVRSSDDQTKRQMPIIALTALAYARDRDVCMNAGASLYLAKPVPLAELVAHLETIIGEAKRIEGDVDRVRAN